MRISLNNIHKFWIQNKIDIIDWITVIAFASFTCFIVAQLYSAKKIIEAQQNTIERLQYDYAEYKNSAELCHSLKSDPQISKIITSK